MYSYIPSYYLPSRIYRGKFKYQELAITLLLALEYTLIKSLFAFDLQTELAQYNYNLLPSTNFKNTFVQNSIMDPSFEFIF